MSRARRPVRRVLIGGGVVLVLAAVLWRPVAIPQLVRFPTDLDQTARYEGSFTVHADPATSAPLDTPIELPMELERRVRTVPGESGARTVVVQELVTYRIGGTEQHETHQYVMDRRSMANRDDPRSFAYDAVNVVDRAGTHRVNLPLGADDDGRYLIWENEPGRSFPMVGLSRGAERDGLSLVEMEEVFERAPVAGYYLDELQKQGFAVTIGFDDLAARLTANGIDVEAALAALPVTDAATIANARAATLPLRFFRDNDGHALVEPRTGAIVDLLVSDEAITATVDLAPIEPLRAALGRSASAPAAAALAGALDDLAAAPPSPVYDLHYRQTASSVAEMVDLTKTELRKLDWVERRVPVLLALAGTSVLAVGLVLARLSMIRAGPLARPRRATAVRV